MSDQSIIPYYLPPGTAEVVQRHGEQCKNLSLILDKYVERAVIDDAKEKGPWLQKRIQSHAIDAELARSAYHRWLSMMKSLNATRFDAPLDWRMIVGLGGETVLETDITLHHLYGIPIIPGSALKGLTRAYVVGEEKAYFIPIDKPEAERKPSLEEKTDHPDIQHIFGTQKKAGAAIFFDALPLNGQATFVVDIMNPHYPDYYDTLKSSAITAPANNQSPKPIPFLTVMNTTFTFALAPRNPNEPQHKRDVELVKKWLQKALQKYGVGGKTSAGYGYFKEDSQSSSRTVEIDKRVQQSAQTQQTVTQLETGYRPNLPKFHEGQELFHNYCTVIVPTDNMRQLYPTASAYLRYQEFSTRDIFIAIEAGIDEASTWEPKGTRGCIITHIEEHADILVLLCKPRPKKNKRARK